VTESPAPVAYALRAIFLSAYCTKHTHTHGRQTDALLGPGFACANADGDNACCYGACMARTPEEPRADAVETRHVKCKCSREALCDYPTLQTFSPLSFQSHVKSSEAQEHGVSQWLSTDSTLPLPLLLPFFTRDFCFLHPVLQIGRTNCNKWNLPTNFYRVSL
jgi:hypothetical protein